MNDRVVSAGPTTDPNSPQCALTGSQQVAPVVSIGPGGEVYLVWQYGPTFDATRNAVAVETLEIAHEGITDISAGTSIGGAVADVLGKIF